MKVSYQYDQDPRYGWASIEVEGKNDNLVIIHSPEYGSLGFEFKNGEMVPTCICSAWDRDECACPNVEWNED